VLIELLLGLARNPFALVQSENVVQDAEDSVDVVIPEEGTRPGLPPGLGQEFAYGVISTELSTPLVARSFVPQASRGWTFDSLSATNI
jgi:hypothetical protein